MKIKKENSTSSKKPFYKRWWFWLIVVFVVIGIGGSSDESTANKTTEDVSGEPTHITAEYNGSRSAGTELNSDSNFSVKEYYSEGGYLEVNDWVINTPVTLQASETSVVTITYKDMSTDVEVKCSTIDENKYKSSCQAISYDELARNGNNYVLTPITFTGKIVQVVEEDGYATYRINVTNKGYGFWDDTIIIGYYPKEGESRFLEDDIVTVYGDCLGLYTYESTMGKSVTIPSALAQFMELN